MDEQIFVIQFAQRYQTIQPPTTSYIRSRNWVYGMDVILLLLKPTLHSLIRLNPILINQIEFDARIWVHQPKTPITTKLYII